MNKKKTVCLVSAIAVAVAAIILTLVLVLSGKTKTDCPYSYKIGKYKNGSIVLTVPKNEYTDAVWVLREAPTEDITIEGVDKGKKNVFTFHFAENNCTATVMLDLQQGEKCIYTITVQAFGYYSELQNKAFKSAELNVISYYGYYDDFVYSDKDNGMQINVTLHSEQNELSLRIKTEHPECLWAQSEDDTYLMQWTQDEDTYAVTVPFLNAEGFDVTITDSKDGRKAILHIGMDVGGRLIPTDCKFEAYSVPEEATDAEYTDRYYKAMLSDNLSVTLPEGASITTGNEIGAMPRGQVTDENAEISYAITVTFTYNNASYTLEALLTTDKSTVSDIFDGLKKSSQNNVTTAENEHTFIAADTFRYTKVTSSNGSIPDELKQSAINSIGVA